MTYHQGRVEQTNVVHLVYWEPNGYSASSGYHALIEQYLTDVAADSGRVTNPYATDTQYDDNLNGLITYKSTFATVSTDTAGFPRRDGSCDLAGATACITEDQTVHELDHFIANPPKGQVLPRSINDIYILVLPKKVQTCARPPKPGGTFDCGPYGPGTSGHTYCAYHSHFDQGSGLTIWANMPYGADADCNVNTSPPNGNDADTLISTLSHEHNETITDPNDGGWFAASGDENGDKCNNRNGATIGATSTGAYDVLINHHPYQIQQEWSNATIGCAMTFGAVAPTAKFTQSPVKPVAGDVTTFDGTVSHSNDDRGYIIDYAWDFGDGSGGSGAKPTHVYAASGTYSVNLTVTDDAGMSASTNGNVVGVPRVTRTAYTGPTAGDYNDPVTLSARLVDGETSAGLAGRSMAFTLGAQSCSATTDASGDAACTITLTQAPGDYAVSASVGGDSAHAASSDSKPFTIRKEDTRVTYSGPPSADYYDAFTASATLVDPDGGAPIPGKAVTLTLGATDSCTRATDAAGNVSCTIVPTQDAGSYTLVASFGPDPNFLSSSDTEPFTITREETITVLTDAPPASSKFGTPVTFTATSMADPPPGAPAPTGLTAFTVDGTPVGSATLAGGSGTTGTSSLRAGPHAVAAHYLGDHNFLPSSAEIKHLVTCDVNISGVHHGALIVTSTTCLADATQEDGAVIVKPGGALDVESSTVDGAIDGDPGTGVIRVCDTSVGGAVDIGGSAALVLVGDPGDASCAPNRISGALDLKDDTNGVEAIANTVGGAITTTGDSGPGPYPGDPTLISGNHPPAAPDLAAPGGEAALPPSAQATPSAEAVLGTLPPTAPPPAAGGVGDAVLGEVVPQAIAEAIPTAARPAVQTPGGRHPSTIPRAPARRTPAAVRRAGRRAHAKHRARRT